jgi:glutathione S-transferase
LSYYTAKLHSYLCYKHIPFQFSPMTMVDLNFRIPKRVGSSVMPVLQCLSTGDSLQDTHDIILLLEKKFHAFPVIPSKDVLLNQSFLSYLIEAWADEFWIPSAMYYRWKFPESVKFFKKEAGQYLLGSTLSSFVPSIFMAPVVNGIADQLRSYLPAVGVRPDQGKLIEQWTDSSLTLLDTHFSHYDYILGTPTPTLADFGLVGPIVAHLCRDPYPLHNVIHRFPNVMEFASRMTGRSWLNDNDLNELTSTVAVPSRCCGTIPNTLIPIVQQIFSEFVPMIEDVQKEVMKVADHPKFSIYGDGRPLPRALGEINVPILHGTQNFKRAALPFNAWKFQQVTKHFQSFSGHQQQDVLQWLKSVDVHNTTLLTEKDFPTLRRYGLKVKL